MCYQRERNHAVSMVGRKKTTNYADCPSLPTAIHGNTVSKHSPPARHHLAEAALGTGSPAHYFFFFFNLRVKGKALEHWKTRLYVRTLNSLHRNI